MGNFFQLKLFLALILYVEVHHPEVRFTYRQSFIHDWCTLFLLLKCLMWHAVAITGLCRAVCSVGSVWGYIVRAALHCRQWIDRIWYSVVCDSCPLWWGTIKRLQKICYSIWYLCILEWKLLPNLQSWAIDWYCLNLFYLCQFSMRLILLKAPMRSQNFQCLN